MPRTHWGTYDAVKAAHPTYDDLQAAHPTYDTAGFVPTADMEGDE
ncbi:MAG: hypothetical protein QG597_1387 [Actinomycetota bacterium]|nr:hypothetical protein [Actinomycetota bacterium]